MTIIIRETVSRQKTKCLQENRYELIQVRIFFIRTTIGFFKNVIQAKNFIKSRYPKAKTREEYVKGSSDKLHRMWEEAPSGSRFKEMSVRNIPVPHKNIERRSQNAKRGLR
jgi:hypothetical protein